MGDTAATISISRSVKRLCLPVLNLIPVSGKESLLHTHQHVQRLVMKRLSCLWAVVRHRSATLGCRIDLTSDRLTLLRSLITRQLPKHIIPKRVTDVVVWFWPFLRADRGRLIILASVTLLITAIESGAPLVVGWVLDQLITTSTVPPTIWWMLTLLAGAAIGRGALIAAQQARIGELSERVAARIRATLWSRLQQAPLEYVRQRGAGRLSLRFISDTRMLQRLLAQGLVQGAQDIFFLALALIILGCLNWHMLIGVAPLLPIYLIAFLRINPVLRKASRSARRQRSRLAAYLHDRFDGIAMVKAYMQYSSEERRLQRLTRRLARYGSRRAVQSGRLQGIAVGAIGICSVLVLMLAATEIAAGRMSGGELVVFYTLLGLMTPIFQRIAVINRVMQESWISLERLQAILQTAPEQPQHDDRPALRVTAGQIVVDQVSCRRSGRGVVLRKVSLTANRGELVAITGPNGSGKSTLLELLLGLRYPDNGRILIDNQSAAEVSLASLRSAIGFVPQDIALFDGSIAENILYGVRHGIPEERLLSAAAITGLDQLIERLPQGWHTRVGRGGSALSGGQRQLIALARALAADPPILVLDEIGSALDAEAEEYIAQTLLRLAEERTIVVATHREATLRLAHRIYVLDQGRVVESGTHTELLNAQGWYARMFGQQADAIRVTDAADT